MAPTLDADSLIAAATERTGLDDFGGESYRAGLDRIIDGLHTEACMNAIGEAIAPEMLVGYLMNRLEVLEWHARNPDMGEAEVHAPVFMIGMGRTATTILHDLLGQDATTRVPLSWEVDRPCPPPEAATYETDPRIAEVEAVIDIGHRAKPEFQAMHPTGARLAQECIRFTGCEFTSLIFLSQFSLPSYMQWLTVDADMAPTYRWHRKFLQLLQWRNPGDRWLLKTGAHLWALPALVAEYPDALFIQTHRDPARVIPSLTTLFAAARDSFSDHITIPSTASEWYGPVVDALDRSVTAREDKLIPADRVLDVQFQEFMDDPLATIRTVYDRWGVDLTPDVEARMRAFLAEHQRDKHGVFRYSLAETQLDEADVRERTRRYTDYFDVPAEAAS